MQSFTLKAVLAKPLDSLTPASLEIELESQYRDRQKALEAIEAMCFIPGSYEVTIKWWENAEKKFKIETLKIERTADRIALDRLSASSTS